ncbi:MAG TPA: hypothetical protein EYN66_17045 [Myxococcales bacterium]|nr:hypothetical protein [Myxococcales bacterium]
MTVFQSSRVPLIIVLLIALSACSTDPGTTPADTKEATQDTLYTDEGTDLTNDALETVLASDVDASDLNPADTDDPSFPGAMARCQDNGSIPN